ncbi:alpha-galactosidase A [Phlyctema vagabunda]|uniref:Alpha-galactosidase A n=1 Tax=Phlyctema vagabunda TaxID=108571 RepID=A0ABR4P5Q9_9HELO
MAERDLTFKDATVLSMYVDEEEDSDYRIQVDGRVRYVSVKPGVYDYEDILCFPPLLIDNLPPFPAGDWITMTVGRDDHGSLTRSISFEPLAAVMTIWHPKQIDISTLDRVERFNPRTYEVEWEDHKTAVAKIARFEFEIPRIERETRVYRALSTMQTATWAPNFLGHLVENGRIMGVLIEKLEGRRAGIEDLDACEAVVTQFHGSGFVHGDLNRHNFLVENGRVTLIDFENAGPYDHSAAQKELDELGEQLREETGRGGPAMPI